MSATVRLLHLEPVAEDTGIVLALLAEAGLVCETTRVGSLEAYAAALDQGGGYDLVLSDLSGATDGLAALAMLRAHEPELPFILFTDTRGEDVAIEALKSGATDYVLKCRVSRLAPVVRRALAEHREREQRKQAEAALRSANGLHRNLLENLPIGVVLISPELEILTLNRQMKTWFPQADPARNPLCYRSLQEPPRDGACPECPVLQTLAGGQVQEQLREKRLAGELKTFKIKTAPILCPEGRVEGVIELVEDVTERLRAEDAIRRSSELLRAAVTTSPLAILMFDRHGQVTLWNDAAERFFGWRAEEVIGKLPPTVTDETFHEFAALRDRVLRGESPAGVELRRRNRQGREIEFSVDASPVWGADGTVSAAMAVITDLGEQKRFARELQESEKRFRAAFEEAACGMTMTALDGSFIKVNRYFSTMLGYRPEEFHDLDLFQVTHPDDLEKSRRWIDGLLAGEDLPPQMEKRFVTRQGDLIWGTVSKRLLRDESGAPLYFINQIQDVTEQKNLEKQLLHAQKMEAVGTLAGGIAHDFNNLLTAILGYAQIGTTLVAADHPLSPHLENIVNTVERAAGLTQSLLAFSRKREAKLRPTDLNRVLEEVGGLLRRVLREDIDLRFSLEETPVTGLVDPWQIEQVLVNLATNARDAMPGGGTLSLKTSRGTIDESFVAAHGYGIPGDYALLTVSDSGCGMDAEVLGKIFEPFFTTKEVNKGSGLGLAIVYGIVKQHEGFVNCYSELGVGTTFRVYLPMAPEADGEQLEQPRPEPQGGDETILLAEDDYQVRALVRDVLERYGYRVLEAADGAEALALFAQHGEGIALAILDMVMPGSSGKEVLRAMRRSRPQLPALVISGYTPEVLHFDEVEASGEQITFISKPFAPNELLLQARTLLDG